MTTIEPALIEQQCALIKEPSKSPTNDQLKMSLDNIMVEINKDQVLVNAKIIYEIVKTIALRSTSDHIFSKSNLLDHQLFVVMRDYYLNLLFQWRNSQLLDEHSSQTFSQIAMLFASLCYEATDINIDALKRLLIHEPLINELRTCLRDISDDGKHLQDKRIQAIDYNIRAIHYLEKGRPEIQSIPLVCAVVDSVVSCVCSTCFITMFKSISGLEKLDEAQTLILDTCTDVISWHDAGFYNQTHIAVRTALLYMFVSWFQNYLSSYQKLSRLAIKIMGQLCITLIGGNASDDDVFPQPIRDDYCKLIDQLIVILSSIAKNGTNYDTTTALTKVLTQCLYSLTMTRDLRMYMKTKKIIPLVLKLTNIEDDTIQFHVYRILAVLLTEEDIKTLTNSSQIASVFLRFLANLIDDSSMVPRFHNLLRSLKVLIQHDQIKEELTKQDVLPLLIRCATESKFDPIKARLPAFEILLALTFNAEAANQLKHNVKFISTMKTLITSSNEQRLQRVAEGLLWKLEKEETAVAKPDVSTTKNESTKSYHIMLSYSHSDKELCYRIHDRLVKDQFRVWIDRDEMHGQPMVAMANAIENSEFVFICMSESYKQSVYCQSEAHYAFERRCHLIPLIMTQQFRPDGWLGILASGKIYIDFPKLGFDVAYEKLKNEMARYRTSQKQTMQNAVSSVLKNMRATNSADKPSQPTLTRDYPKCINQWTNNHVRSFLINEKFESLLPVVGSMNGHLLHETYKACKAHWDLTFQTFKAEVAADGQHSLLTVATYIRFLDEIEKYVPVGSGNDSKPALRASALCNLL